MPIKRIVAVLAALVVVFVMSRRQSPVTSPSVPRWPNESALANFDEDLAAIAAKSDELDARRERLLREIHFSTHLARQLESGRLSLQEAAARMEPLLCERNGFDLVCRMTSGVENTRRGTARYLIKRVEQLLELEPYRWRQVSRRLEAEFVALR